MNNGSVVWDTLGFLVLGFLIFTIYKMVTVDVEYRTYCLKDGEVVWETTQNGIETDVVGGRDHVILPDGSIIQGAECFAERVS